MNTDEIVRELRMVKDRSKSTEQKSRDAIDEAIRMLESGQFSEENRCHVCGKPTDCPWCDE